MTEEIQRLFYFIGRVCQDHKGQEKILFYIKCFLKHAKNRGEVDSYEVSCLDRCVSVNVTWDKNQHYTQTFKIKREKKSETKPPPPPPPPPKRLVREGVKITTEKTIRQDSKKIQMWIWLIGAVVVFVISFLSAFGII